MNLYGARMETHSPSNPPSSIPSSGMKFPELSYRVCHREYRDNGTPSLHPKNTHSGRASVVCPNVGAVQYELTIHQQLARDPRKPPLFRGRKLVVVEPPLVQSPHVVCVDHLGKVHEITHVPPKEVGKTVLVHGLFGPEHEYIVRWFAPPAMVCIVADSYFDRVHVEP